MVSTCLADMIDLLWAWVQSAPAPAPLPVGETGVARARATRAEGDHPPAGPLEERVCTSAYWPREIQGLRKRGRPGRPLRSAPAFAGASPWRARGAEPHSSSIQKKKRLGEATAKITRVSRDRLKRQPQERQHSAAEGGTRDRLPPASNSRQLHDALVSILHL